MTTQQLVQRLRLAQPGRRGQRLSVKETREWLRDLEAKGWIVEKSCDDWYPTKAGSLYFAPWVLFGLDLEDAA